jgi:hypothetical protein
MTNSIKYCTTWVIICTIDLVGIESAPAGDWRPYIMSLEALVQRQRYMMLLSHKSYHQETAAAPWHIRHDICGHAIGHDCFKIEIETLQPGNT